MEALGWCIGIIYFCSHLGILNNFEQGTHIWEVYCTSLIIYPFFPGWDCQLRPHEVTHRGLCFVPQDRSIYTRMDSMPMPNCPPSLKSLLSVFRSDHRLLGTSHSLASSLSQTMSMTKSMKKWVNQFGCWSTSSLKRCGEDLLFMRSFAMVVTDCTKNREKFQQ